MLEYSDLSDFTRGYIDAIFFTEEELEGKSFEDFAPDSLTHIVQDCAGFDMENKSLLTRGYLCKFEYAGHDFWLTRNHHGAGFWDRGLGAIGEELTKMCEKYPAKDVYIGDDGKIYL